MWSATSGVLKNDTMGRMGVLGLWIFGNPYNCGALGCKFLHKLKTELLILPSLSSFLGCNQVYQVD